MIRAILAGRKAVTRRIVKPQPSPGCRYEMNGAGDRALHLHGYGPALRFVPAKVTTADHRLACPYGEPGDRLWVRETWCQQADPITGRLIDRKAYYAADGVEVTHVDDINRSPWRPSIHMPRWASRITLDVVSVRVERLHDITPGDILAEGVVERPHVDPNLGKCPVSAFDGKLYPDLRSLWAAGWDQINGKRAPWKANPWVWRVEFRRMG